MEAGKPAHVRPRAKYGPESQMYDTFKGREVFISWKNGGERIRATLLWVDRYTVGVRAQNGNEQMVYKDAIKMIELVAA